jgi:uncharacterized protein YbbK (DUF523 family)
MNRKVFKICSACLIGVNCRYNGKEKPNDKILKLLKKENLIPVCPEQLGGLPTPREPAERRGNKVLTKSGKEVTSNFKKGAKEVLKIAKIFNVKEAILKQRSPSCGSGIIYDGTFSNKLTRGEGVTTTLLRKNGVRVISEENL